MPGLSALRTTAVALTVLVAVPALAQVRGTVTNGTTGAPAAGVALTLSTFSGGMRPVEEVQSGPDGSFAFTKQLPAVSSDQPFQGSIRAEFEGIGYTEVLRSDASRDDVRVTVYSARSTDIPPPDMRVVWFQPEGERLRVHELYQLVNDSDSPVTYSSEEGTLRFHLPSAAAGDVEVSGTGPAGMPLQSSALPAGEPGLYLVDFPLKPGENRISVSYSVPHQDGGDFTLRSLYPGLRTRVAAPDGVEIGGEGLTPMAQDPATPALAYELASDGDATLSISGQELRQQSDISVQPAPVASELSWLVGLATLILGVGFLHLLKSQVPQPPGAQRGERG